MAQNPPIVIPQSQPGMMDQGADPLARLRDIHLPNGIDTWPPAPGWWVLAALVGAAICAALYWMYRNWRANRYRREALAELSALTERFGESPTAYLEHYSALLKRVALTRYPRDTVAGLTGAQWTRFLDQTGGTHEFSMGAGQALITGVYEQEVDADVARLHQIGEHWIREHGDLADDAASFQEAAA